MVSYTMRMPEREEATDTPNTIVTAQDEFYVNCIDCGDQTNNKPYCEPCLENHRDEIINWKDALYRGLQANPDLIIDIEEIEKTQQSIDRLE